MRGALLYGYFFGDLATLIYLALFDGTHYNWWNWLLIIPLDILLATIWPVYWLILRPLLQ